MTWHIGFVCQCYCRLFCYFFFLINGARNLLMFISVLATNIVQRTHSNRLPIPTIIPSTFVGKINDKIRLTLNFTPTTSVLSTIQIGDSFCFSVSQFFISVSFSLFILVLFFLVRRMKTMWMIDHTARHHSKRKKINKIRKQKSRAHALSVLL